MHYKDKKVYVAVMILLFFIACKKESATLPPFTHSGQNMLACLVNGSPLIVYGHITSPSFSTLTTTFGGVEYVEVDSLFFNHKKQ